jgi:hypothetical protein
LIPTLTQVKLRNNSKQASEASTKKRKNQNNDDHESSTAGATTTSFHNPCRYPSDHSWIFGAIDEHIQIIASIIIIRQEQQEFECGKQGRF